MAPSLLIYFSLFSLGGREGGERGPRGVFSFQMCRALLRFHQRYLRRGPCNTLLATRSPARQIRVVCILNYKLRIMSFTKPDYVLLRKRRGRRLRCLLMFIVITYDLEGPVTRPSAGRGAGLVFLLSFNCVARGVGLAVPWPEVGGLA